MQVGHKFTEYSIENFIHLIIEEHVKKEELVAKIRNINANKELISKTLQKVDFAYKRIDKPLENDVKFYLLIFPFGIVNRFDSTGFFDTRENRRLGFVKKVKEFYMYSFIGVLLYAIIVILIIFIF